MKIRHGFVSNSSSSSFIVGLAKKPRSVRALQALLFGGAESVMLWEDYVAPASRLAKRIFDDLKIAKPVPDNRLLSIASGGTVEPDDGSDDVDYNLFETDGGFDHHSYDLACARRANQAVTKMRKEAGKVKWYVLHYSDNGGSRDEVILEHGNVFATIPHLKISEH